MIGRLLASAHDGLTSWPQPRYATPMTWTPQLKKLAVGRYAVYAGTTGPKLGEVYKAGNGYWRIGGLTLVTEFESKEKAAKYLAWAKSR